MTEMNKHTQAEPQQPPAPGDAAGDSRRAYLDLCQHLEHGDSDELLSDYTATMVYAIAAPERPAALDLLRSQLYSRKLAAGRVESWYVDCGVRLREDPQGFCAAAVQEHVRRGLAAEAAAQAAQKAQKAATPRLLPASAFAAEQAPPHRVLPAPWDAVHPGRRVRRRQDQPGPGYRRRPQRRENGGV